VSPLWRSEIGISLAPHRATLVRMSRGIKPRVLAEKVIALQPSHYGDWSPALGALAGCLAEGAWGGANARIVLSDHWTRYAVLPSSAVLGSSRERLSAARYVLADLYGEAVAAWQVILGDVRPGVSQIACAIPPTLLAEVLALAQAHGLDVISLQPQLIVSCNRWRHVLPSSGAWFVSVEEGSLAAARITSGRWDRVHAVRIGADWLIELKRLRTFGRLASSASEGARVFIEAPLCLREVAGKDDSDLEWLEPHGRARSTGDQLAFIQRLQA
jgi:hypothetical protein